MKKYLYANNKIPDLRFIRLSYENSGLKDKNELLVDRETGVTYLLLEREGFGISLTVLLDKDGKPIITKID